MLCELQPTLLYLPDKVGTQCDNTIAVVYSASHFPHRFSLVGVEEAPKAQLTVCVSTQNRPKSYQRVAKLSSHLLS